MTLLTCNALATFFIGFFDLGNYILVSFIKISSFIIGGCMVYYKQEDLLPVLCPVYGSLTFTLGLNMIIDESMDFAHLLKDMSNHREMTQKDWRDYVNAIVVALVSASFYLYSSKSKNNK